MNRRHFVSVVAAISLGGCTGVFNGDDPSRIDLTVQNNHSDPVTIQIMVVDTEGTSYADESDQIDSGVAQAYEIPVGTDGRHEVTVSGADWQGQLAWNADTCAVFDGTIRITEDSIEVAGECVQQR